MEQTRFEQYEDVVLSTRVRLARNLRTMPFPHRLSEAGRAEVVRLVENAVKGLSGAQLEEINMDTLGGTRAVSLVEQHWVSPEIISSTAGRALFIDRAAGLAIMVNEEDHLRIQAMAPGFCLSQTYTQAERVDRFLEEKLPFAFDDEFGYLTQCPTNLGTGMRASLMLHLPAMRENGVMQRMANNLAQIGLTLRGIYGEGTEPKGAIYQLSNQVTLGLSEKEAIGNLNDIAVQLINQERSMRQSLMSSEKVQDIVLRSMGILQNARLLTNDEFMTLASQLRMGVCAGLIENVEIGVLNRLLIETQPATLMERAGQKLAPEQRDRMRAALVKRTLAGAREAGMPQRQ